MRLAIGMALAIGLSAMASAASAQVSNGTVTYSDGGAMPTGQVGYYSPMPDGPKGVVPTRYEISLDALRAQMVRQARLDGGHLSAKHQAEFQQALDDTNRHFHKGPYALQYERP